MRGCDDAKVKNYFSRHKFSQVENPVNKLLIFLPPVHIHAYSQADIMGHKKSKAMRENNSRDFNKLLISINANGGKHKKEQRELYGLMKPHKHKKGVKEKKIIIFIYAKENEYKIVLELNQTASS